MTDHDLDRGLYRIHYRSLDVQLLYQDQSADCQGGRAPSVEISTRWAPADTGSPLRPAQPFSEWKLSRFYTGEQVSSLILFLLLSLTLLHMLVPRR